MAHYSGEEWKAFIEGTLEEEKFGAMEEHLLECDKCVEEYLSCFSKEGAADDVIELHPRFTSNVMKRINHLETRRRVRAKGRDIFYYSVAACLTIFFVYAGVFEGFACMIPEITQERLETLHPFQEDSQSIIEFGWSDKLMNSTLTFIDTMKPKGEEVLD
ncbi:MAG: hypothetical protein WCS98_02035 [Bacillota bacterium]|jgi:predicted anti-sigma-YlaC factor YlaD|nr:hypothetical protein [Bacillota bacterium]MDD3298292.1 hypothetical protein [Bacillota bacterium]MDD3850326.1 hypothetical protein [Bacillota bacterium]MDD4706998.1 hypothetical protein [Bacillota bacterium]